jgi:membrane protease YdiL (CAAX protease family)
MSILLTSALYSMAHFLKTPDQPATLVTWLSGFNSVAHSFAQLADPTLLMASFSTLFLIGLILANGRMRTQSLWLPIGLHAGWIFANGAVAQFLQLQKIVMPWLGRNLLVGIVPLGLGCLTWGLMTIWLKNYGSRKT